jgi:glycosyltransferase involved in cell wall biosynthesis
MHVLFFHQRFPAQFGHIARHLVKKGIECTYVCELPPASQPELGPVRYVTDFPAGERLGIRAPSEVADDSDHGIRQIYYPPAQQAPTTFDGQVVRGYEIHRYLNSLAPLRPDVAVGSGNFGSSLFLQDLYQCPLLHYFDYYYRASDSYLHFRPEFPASELDVFRARAYNALVLLDLHTCAAGYTPTEWQKSLYPIEYQHKITTLFDGIDRDFWYRRPVARGSWLPADKRIITYVARGLESLRGFDIFMKVAQRILQARQDVFFVVVGSDHFYHGIDLQHIQTRSFLEHVCLQDKYDFSHFLFTDRIPSHQLVEILSLSDLHIYLTAPFVLSWSLFNALACGCTVLASDTSPVREVICHQQTGLLAGFFDIDGLTRLALQVLENPEAFRHLGQKGMELIDEKYSLARTVPAMVQLLETTARKVL